MHDKLEDLNEEECIEYAAQCLAEGIGIPKVLIPRLKDMDVYDLLTQAGEDCG